MSNFSSLHQTFFFLAVIIFLLAYQMSQYMLPLLAVGLGTAFVGSWCIAKWKGIPMAWGWEPCMEKQASTPLWVLRQCGSRGNSLLSCTECFSESGITCIRGTQQHKKRSCVWWSSETGLLRWVRVGGRDNFWFRLFSPLPSCIGFIVRDTKPFSSSPFHPLIWFSGGSIHFCCLQGVARWASSHRLTCLQT